MFKRVLQMLMLHEFRVCGFNCIAGTLGIVFVYVRVNITTHIYVLYFIVIDVQCTRVFHYLHISILRMYFGGYQNKQGISFISIENARRNVPVLVN